jgi:HNH endonuclease
MLTEIYLPIPNFDRYKISNKGHILMAPAKGSSRVLEKRIHGCQDKDGYLNICMISNDGVWRSKKIHRIVASMFLESFDNLLTVNHKNGIKKDNSIENLEMVTHKENMLHAKLVLGKKFQKHGAGNSFYKGAVSGINKITGVKITLEGKQAMKDAGFRPGCIYDCLSGKQSFHKGYSWARKLGTEK